MATFAEWVQENWPVKLDIIKGDFNGAPNEDSTVGDYPVYPALLFDESNSKFYLRNQNEWVEINNSKESTGFNGNFVETLFNSIETEQGIKILNSYGNEGESRKLRIESEGLVKALKSDGKLNTLFNSLEGPFIKSLPATQEESGSIRYKEEGKVKANENDSGGGSLDKKVDLSKGYKFPYTKATNQEEESLWIGESGTVKASSSDKGTDDLYKKIQTGRRLETYRGKGNESEELRISLDDETQELIDNLKYEHYIKRTEERRSNDIYVDSKTAPYLSTEEKRDGTPNRPYLTIKEAVESEQAQKQGCTIWVRSGIYIEEAPIKLPPSTSVIGAELRRCEIYPTTDTCGATYDRNGGGTYLFEVTFDCIVRNFAIRGIVAPGFAFGFREDANLKTISPYMQNLTAYNDGRDVHKIFNITFTDVSPFFLPNPQSLVPYVRVIPRDATHPNYDPNQTQPNVVEIDREVEKNLKLAIGQQYNIDVKNSTSQWLRFTFDTNNFDQVPFSAESPGSTTLDLSNLRQEQLNKQLYYVLFPDAIENEPSIGKVDLLQPNNTFDEYVIRPGDKVEEIEVNPIPINLERGDSFYIGDEGSFPISILSESLEEENIITQLPCKQLKKKIEIGEDIYLFNQEKTTEFKVSETANVGQKFIKVEEKEIKWNYVQGSTIHYQHPNRAQRFTLVENAPKGSKKLKVGTFKTFNSSKSIVYELTNTFELPPNDQLPLEEELDSSLSENEELWLLETVNDRATVNHFSVKVKETAETGDSILKVTNAYCSDSERDLAKIQVLRPKSGQNPLEEEKPISNVYIRPDSKIIKDPFERRNGGGGAHVDGFRLNPKTRLSADPPLSRLMCFNDYTQINVNGYGILSEGIANAECVSVFTYFCNNGLYAKNGGEIRALNCSNAFGVYGCKAEGFLGFDPERTDENTPEITAEKLWVGYEYNQESADLSQDPKLVEGDLLGSVATIENPQYNPTKEDTTAEPKIGSLIRVNGSNVVGIVDVERYIRNDGNIFVQIIIGGTWNEIGVDSPDEISPLGDLNNNSNTDGIYEFRSVVRMTGHDFGFIGTGPRYPRKVGGSGVPVQENETKVLDFGQIFWSASDQLGNFTVGEFFRVDQNTGRVSFNADDFDLTGINEFGPFRDSLDNAVGTVMREISSSEELVSERDGRGTDPGPNTVPTQTAVKTYVDQRVGAVVDVVIYFSTRTTVSMGGSTGELFGSIQVLRGLTYRFIIETDNGVTPGKFTIVDENNNVLSEDRGVQNNASNTGNILYTVPFDAPDKVYYRIDNNAIQEPSTLHVLNPDIRLPNGDVGAIQYHGKETLNDGTERSVFKSNPNIKVVGNSLKGSFQGTFVGDGQFLENITVKLGLDDIEGIDLGTISQLEEEDTIVYFKGTDEEKNEWRLAKPFLPIQLADGSSSNLPIRYNIKEGSPEIPFVPGKLEFFTARSSHLIAAVI